MNNDEKVRSMHNGAWWAMVLGVTKSTMAHSNSSVKFRSCDKKEPFTLLTPDSEEGERSLWLIVEEKFCDAYNLKNPNVPFKNTTHSDGC